MLIKGVGKGGEKVKAFDSLLEEKVFRLISVANLADVSLNFMNF